METEERRKEIINLQLSFMEVKKDIEFIKSSMLEDKKAHKEILEKIDDFIKTCDEKYVSKDIFRPIQKLVYSLVGGVLIIILKVIMDLIIK